MKIVLIAAGIVCAMCVAAAAITYREIRSEQDGVDRNWSALEKQLERRTALVSELAKVTRPEIGDNQEVLMALVAMNQAAARQQKMDASARLAQAFDRLRDTAQKHSRLETDPQLAALIAQWDDLKTSLATAARDYNNAAQDYNTGIQLFPKNVIAGMFRIPAAPYFHL